MAKGQKTCPKCLRTAGPRKKKCECGYDFPIKYAPEKAAARRAATVAKKEEKTGPPLIFTCGKDFFKLMPKLPSKVNPDTFAVWVAHVKEYPVKLPHFCGGGGQWGYFSKSAIRAYIEKIYVKTPKNADILNGWLDKIWVRHNKEIIPKTWSVSTWY